LTGHLTLINYFFAYAEALEDAFKRFARHINENNWDRTVFQFYLNNKLSYRENGNVSGAPWLLVGHPVNLLHKPFPQTAAAPFTPPSIGGPPENLSPLLGHLFRAYASVQVSLQTVEGHFF
jgi:hypothetical protein